MRILSPPERELRPNIVIIISDDHAYEAITAYAVKLMQTPAINQIAKEAVPFKITYVTNSICCPSRATIISGKYSLKLVLKTFNIPVSMDLKIPFVMELTKAGYQIAWIGKWHLQTEPQVFSFWQILQG